MRLSEELYGAIHEMSARQVRKVLRKAGCSELRQKGSHVQVTCPPNLKSTVPDHGSKDIKKGTLKAIEKSLQVDIDGDGKPRPKGKKGRS
jgi:predicted RNA binding protein YcfA (HicA-like mRNA interferase family)